MFRNVIIAAVAISGFTIGAPVVGSAAVVSPGLDPAFVQSTAGVRYRSFGNTGGEEVYIADPNNNFQPPRSAQNLTWLDGDNTFAFTIDLDNDLLTSTVNGNTALTRAYTDNPVINAFKVTLSNRDDGDISISNLVINGTNVGDFTGAGFLDFTVTGLAPSTLFNLSGAINRSGSFGISQELSRVEFVAGSVAPIPLPAAAWMLIAGLGGLAAVARKRRAA